MFDFLKPVRGSKEPTAADLRRALDGLDLLALSEDVAAGEAVRRHALLSATDAEVLAAEKRIAAARLALERAEAARTELSMRIVAAEKREAGEALNRERDEVNAEINALAADLRKRWPAAQRALLDLLARVDAVGERARTVNERLVEAGRADEELALDPVAGDIRQSFTILPRIEGLGIEGTPPLLLSSSIASAEDGKTR